MARTVNDAFKEFNANTVNLVKERTDKARVSRDWLLTQLALLPDKIDDFPLLCDKYNIKFGSFARNTKIKPIDDIDLMLGLHGNGAYYNKSMYGTKYTIHIENDNSRLWAFRDAISGAINSIKMVNKLVSSLKKISHYENSAIHRRQEAATLKLNSYEWNFDIVPAFFTTADFYLIPDGQGNWKATDPRIDEKRVTEINKKHDGKVLQLIRTLKYWNKRPNMPTIPSYLFENIILNYCNNKNEISQYIDVEIIKFWEHLGSAILNKVADPKGFIDDLNDLDIEKRKRISNKAQESYNKGIEAYNFETVSKDQEKAINKWREVFGDEFPKYE